jgi:hypothetical protein
MHNHCFAVQRWQIPTPWLPRRLMQQNMASSKKATNRRQPLQTHSPQALQAIKPYKRSTGDDARDKANPVPA